MSERNEAVNHLQLRLSEYFGSDVKEVFSYLPSDFQGLSPAIAIFVGGTQPEKITPGHFRKQHLIFLYMVAVYGVKGVPELTEEKAQSVLGTLYDKLLLFVEEFKTENGFWISLQLIEMSEVSPMKLAGRPYFVEIVPLIVDVY